MFFEESAEDYHRLRPGYPAALFSDLSRLTGLGTGTEAVEVGSGTGLATEGLLRLNWRVTCVEPAAQMAAIARATLGDAFTLVPLAFEDWEAPGDSADVVFAATSWMWVRQEIGFPKAAALLRDDGFLALSWQTLVSLGPDGIQERLESVYEALAPQMKAVFFNQQTVHDGWPERVAASGYFTAPETLAYPFARSFDARSFVAATFTYGMHGELDPGQRARLAEGLVAAIDAEYGGRVERYEQAYLYLARRSHGE